MGGELLCRSLGLLKQDMGDLKVDEKLLDIMQKWECLTARQATSLLEKPEGERLNSMMSNLERRTPGEWGLLVCVFLETERYKMAKSSWRALQEHLRGLQVNGDTKKALDTWATFVRQMSVLVQDQETLHLVDGKQRKTASEIWEAILKEAAESTCHAENELNMWTILVSSVTAMLEGSEQETGDDIWKGLISNVKTRMTSGEGKKAIIMYKCLVEKAKTVAFSRPLLQQILRTMVNFMLDVQDSRQGHFFGDVRRVLVEHLRDLYALDQTQKSDGLQERETAEYLFHRLIDSITDLLKKGARKAGKDMWKDLVDVQQRLEDNDTHGKMLLALYSVLVSLKNEELADTLDLQEMRDMLSSGARSMMLQPCSSIQVMRDGDDGNDANDGNVPSSSAQLNVPLIERYSTSRSANLALVINNVDFRDAFDRRDGSEMDELALPRLLEKLGFLVQQESNLTKDELYRAIAIFADRPEHASADMAVLAVMTHGVNEGLVGSDEKVLSFQAVVNCFSNERAPKLAGKPKWLSLQACRNMSEETNYVPDGPRCSDDSRLHVDDIFITHTALPRQSAKRNKIAGTLYVQALKDVLDLPQAHTLSLFELHVKVQEIMTGIWKREMARGTPDTKTSLSEPKLEVRTLGWKKKLFFDQYAIGK